MSRRGRKPTKLNLIKSAGKRGFRTQGSKKKVISRLRGMKDILPDEYRYWDMVLRKAEDLIVYYGFKVDNAFLLNKEILIKAIIKKLIKLLNKELKK